MITAAHGPGIRWNRGGGLGAQPHAPFPPGEEGHKGRDLCRTAWRVAAGGDRGGMGAAGEDGSVDGARKSGEIIPA